MSVYGPNPNQQIPFTGWSPTLSLGNANVPAVNGAAQFNGVMQSDDRFVKTLRSGTNRKFRRVLRVLVTSGVGATATETRTRVKATQGLQPSLVPIETVTLINRSLVTPDLQMMQALIDRVTAPTVYPPDLSGAGGGGKQHYMGVG
jgi:hypothetical protein